MLNIKKIAELVELSKETGARVDVGVHDFNKREDAVAFKEELSSALNIEFYENESEKVKWFSCHVDGCEITIFFESEFIENVG